MLSQPYKCARALVYSGKEDAAGRRSYVCVQVKFTFESKRDRQKVQGRSRARVAIKQLKEKFNLYHTHTHTHGFYSVDLNRNKFYVLRAFAAHTTGYPPPPHTR